MAGIARNLSAGFYRQSVCQGSQLLLRTSVCFYQRQIRELASLPKHQPFGRSVRQISGERITSSKDDYPLKSVLDLRETLLPRSELEELATRLKNSVVMRIEWHLDQFANDDPLLTTINKTVQENYQAFEERPSPYICARFCQLSCKSPDELKQKNILPKGWEILDFLDATKDEKYFGVAFVNHSTGHVILSHRGTDNLFRDLADIPRMVDEGAKGQQDLAVDFTQQVLDKAEKLGYRVGIVGHSLGGLLAQFTACLSSSKGYEDVYAVTFDSPGAGKVIEKFGAQGTVSMVDLDTKELDFTHYVSSPNWVNTCHGQVGDVFPIIPESLSVFGGLGNLKQRVTSCFLNYFMPSTAYFFETHSLDRQVAAFDPKSGRPKRSYQAVSWPDRKKMGKYSEIFFQLAEENSVYLPETEYLSLADQYIIKYVGGYNVVEAKRETMRLSHFPPRIREWLLKIDEKQKNDRDIFSSYLSSLEDRVNLPKDALQNLLKFCINSEGGEITVFTTEENAWEFRNHVAKLLKTYPELISTVNGSLVGDVLAISTPLEIASSVLKDRTKALIRSFETVILARFRIPYSTAKKEIGEHEQDKEKLAQEIEEIDLVIQDLPSSFTDSRLIEEHKGLLEEQKAQLKIMQGISQALIDYKTRNFEGAGSQAIEVLTLMGDYEQLAKKNLQFPRLRAVIYSLLAKIKGDFQKEVPKLEEAEKCYLLALDQKKGLPHVDSLWGDYGKILTRRGRCLGDSVVDINKAIQCYQVGFDTQETAHKLSLEGNFFFQDPRFFLSNEIRENRIKTDLRIAILCLAEGEFRVGHDSKKRQGKIERALLLPDLEEGDFSSELNPLANVARRALKAERGEGRSDSSVKLACELFKVKGDQRKLDLLARLIYRSLDKLF